MLRLPPFACPVGASRRMGASVSQLRQPAGLALHMQGGGFQGLAKGLGKWVSDKVADNMGKLEAEQEKVRAALQVEDPDAPQPSYDFKFASSIEDKLSAADTAAAGAAAGKKKVKKVVQSEGGKQVEVDTRFFEVSLDRPTGVEFATDLSLKYVYVMEVKENSPAQLSVTPVEVGDQLVGVNGDECIGQPFGEVAELLGKAPAEPLRFRLFRGSKQELLEATGREDYVPTSAKVTSYQPDQTGGQPLETSFDVAAGANLRDSLIDQGVQVYNIQSGRWVTNTQRPASGALPASGCDPMLMRMCNARAPTPAQRTGHRVISCICNGTQLCRTQTMQPTACTLHPDGGPYPLQVHQLQRQAAVRHVRGQGARGRRVHQQQVHRRGQLPRQAARQLPPVVLCQHLWRHHRRDAPAHWQEAHRVHVACGQRLRGPPPLS